ncbi:MAG: hypothetical protein P4M07_20480 [Xanthobacteraceae bacterium]|nr:hypothetical protein [Xanthobacteraceae bacterium]
MEKLIIAAALACQPGHRLVDWSDRLPAGTYAAEFTITVNPYYTRVLIYRPGHPEEVRRCCGDRPISTVRVPITDGRFCVGRSQPQMTYNVRLALKPDLAL